MPDYQLEYDASPSEMTLIAGSELEGPSIFASSDAGVCPINECWLVDPARCSSWPAESFDNTDNWSGADFLSLPDMILFDGTDLKVKKNTPEGFSHEICVGCVVD
jgi:hypothetical protein